MWRWMGREEGRKRGDEAEEGGEGGGEGRRDEAMAGRGSKNRMEKAWLPGPGRREE